MFTRGYISSIDGASHSVDTSGDPFFARTVREVAPLREKNY
jgi:hypothetical protein